MVRQVADLADLEDPARAHHDILKGPPPLGGKPLCSFRSTNALEKPKSLDILNYEESSKRIKPFA